MSEVTVLASAPLWEHERAVRLTQHQADELRTYAKQIQDLVAQRQRFLVYCVRESGSQETGPFELVQNALVPANLLPRPVRL